MKEIWKDVPGFEGIVQASNLGRLKVYRDGMLCTYESYDNEYHQVHVNGTALKIHQWVAKAFIPNPDDKPTVNHIDGNKGNNRPDNLEWNTYKENNEHAQRTGLNDLNVPGGKAETRRLKTISMPVIVYSSSEVYVFFSLSQAARYMNKEIRALKNMSNVKVFPRGTKLEDISELEGISYEIIHERVCS